MDAFEVIAKRHSYRGEFSAAPVSRDDLRRIVEAGLQAPSGCNGQTTRFIVVDSLQLVEEIHTISAMPAVQTANAFIFCVVDKQPEPVIDGMSFQVEDCSAAVQNMLLAITALGYASVWLDGMLRRSGLAQRIGGWLNLPEGKEVRVMLPVGVPQEQKSSPPKMSLERRVFWNVYKNEGGAK